MLACGHWPTINSFPSPKPRLLTLAGTHAWPFQSLVRTTRTSTSMFTVRNNVYFNSVIVWRLVGRELEDRMVEPVLPPVCWYFSFFVICYLIWILIRFWVKMDSTLISNWFSNWITNLSWKTCFSIAFKRPFKSKFPREEWWFSFTLIQIAKVKNHIPLSGEKG